MLNELVAHLVFLVGAGLQYYYLRFLYLYLHKPYAYAPTSIENIAIYGSFVGVFWATATIYGLQSFINLASLDVGDWYIPSFFIAWFIKYFGPIR
jgi:hypothetical protein